MVTNEASPPDPISTPFAAAIIESVAHPIFVKDRALRFVFVNRSLCELVGRSREELIGKTDLDFFPAAEAEFFQRKDQEVLDSREPRRIEREQITDALGAVHVLSTTKVPLYDADGQASHIVGIIHDLTELARAEGALRDANDELERRVAERSEALRAAQEELVRSEGEAVLGRLASTLAHQVRNPLATIANSAYLLRRHGKGRAEFEEPVAIILEEVWRATRILDALLTHARQRPPNLRRSAVAELMGQLLTMVSLPGTVRLERQLEEPLPEVLIDREQTCEALCSLVQNAVEAMAKGGVLTLGARGEGETVVVWVRDTGSGIPTELQPRLFQPLVTTKPLGLGLGLMSARRLVECQQGSIRFESAPGSGTVFEVRLPAAR